MDLLFCFVFDTVMIFCDDFEWIFLLFFLGFCFLKKFSVFGFLFCLLANHLNRVVLIFSVVGYVISL